MTKHPCPLCDGNETRLAADDRGGRTNRYYVNCPECDLSFVPKEFHLSHSDEKAIYDYHQNDPTDTGYRKFLSRLATPLMDLLDPGAKGLDFGCGPGPTLSLMLREAGYNTTEYDIYYAPDEAALNTHYDFITSTEVIEHLSEPGQVIEMLFSMLMPKGILGIMTKRRPDCDFLSWHYIQDPTHICFFSDKSLNYIADKYQCELTLIGNDTAIFKRC